MIWKHENTVHRKGEKAGRVRGAVLWMLAFPGESIPNVQCIALGQESYPRSVKTVCIAPRTVKRLWPGLFAKVNKVDWTFQGNGAEGITLTLVTSRLLSFEMCLNVNYRSKYAVSSKNVTDRKDALSYTMRNNNKKQ